VQQCSAMKTLGLWFIVWVVPMSAFAESPLQGVGARVGGYGFREGVDASGETSGTGWQACRMNGVGVFGIRDLSRHFFLEGGLDTYFADSAVVPSSMGAYDTPVDRVSGLVSVAAGARLAPEALISPFVQVGVGGELTRVRLPELGLEDSAILPMGFFGAGANLRLGERFIFSASLRVNVMGYYDDSQFQSQLDARPELATQGQFALAYRL